MLAGVLAGCGGFFLPGDRGLSPLSQGVPWAVQSALYGSVYYCFAGVPAGAGIGDVAVSLVFHIQDLKGNPHLTCWYEFARRFCDFLLAPFSHVDRVYILTDGWFSNKCSVWS